MANTKKLIQAAAGAAGGAGLNVEEVFSTYLYTGNGTARSISNGIDLDGEGGLVWTKSRSAGIGSALVDTENGVGKYLRSDSTAALRTDSNAQEGVTSFNSDGYSLGAWTNEDRFNRTNYTYASWTFRKAPKFFDIVTYTGTGSAQTISHNLGSKPNFYVVKQTSGSGGSWYGYHAGLDSTYTNPSGIRLDSTSAAFEANSSLWNLTFPTSTTFTVGTSTGVNASGETYVAYLFAHNDGDGEFGPDGDADIIKCGSYTGTGTAGHFIDLGFEPQWLMIKRSDAAGSWEMLDIMRGMPAGGEGSYLRANSSNAEATSSNHSVTPSPTGFTIESTSNINGSGDSFIYIAIRRGPMAVPESATDVFAIDDGGSGGFSSGFPVDTVTTKNKDFTNDWRQYDRLRGHTNKLENNTSDAESGLSSGDSFASMDSFAYGLGADHIGYMWRRAPNFFDVVCYDGDATASPNSRDIEHNLGVAPEMMWIKCRSFGENWAVYHSGIGATKYLNLNGTAAAATSANWWRNTTPTDTVFTIGHQDDVNANGETHIAYLFASLDGVSKVGSYTGNGTSQNIDCGFSSGARFVLIKPNRSGDAWYVWDSTRGIVSGNDPFLLLNTTDAEITGADYIDPYSGGFNVTGGAGTVNRSGIEHIFYAIA